MERGGQGTERGETQMGRENIRTGGGGRNRKTVMARGYWRRRKHRRDGRNCRSREVVERKMGDAGRWTQK